jgi:small subunit ribosomal protein S13
LTDESAPKEDNTEEASQEPEDYSPSDAQKQSGQPQESPSEEVGGKPTGKKEESEVSKEKQELPAEKKETTREEKKKPSDQPPQKKAKKGASAKNEDFKYIVRLADTDIDGEKSVIYGLTSIKGIGMHMSSFITNITKIDRNMKIGDLTDAQIEQIRQALVEITKDAPRWMLNHRKDPETGGDLHFIGSQIDMNLRDEVNIMKKIRSYRGIRHEMGLRARGQRTRANNRRGLSLGVSRRRE